MIIIYLIVLASEITDGRRRGTKEAGCRNRHNNCTHQNLKHLIFLFIFLLFLVVPCPPLTIFATYYLVLYASSRSD